MKNVSSARVQVLPTRLKKSIKKEISNLDREIQGLNADISRCKSNLTMFSEDSPFTEKWRSHLGKIEAKRESLDETRKTLRLKLKGYTN